MSRHGMGSCKVPCQSEKVLRIIAIFKDCPLRLGVKPYGWQHVTDAVRHSHPLCSPGLAAATLNMYLLRTLSVNSDPILQNSCPATCRKRPETFANGSPGKCYYSGPHETFAKGSPGKCYYSGPHETFDKARPANVTTPGVRRLLQKARPANVTTPGFRNLFCKRLARQMLLLLQKARPTNARPAQNSHMQNCRALKEFPAKCQGYQDLPDRARLLQLFCAMGFFGHHPTWAPAFVGPGPRAGVFAHTHTHKGRPGTRPVVLDPRTYRLSSF